MATKKSAAVPENEAPPINVTLSLNSGHLKSALACAAKQDVRYYLNGVLLEVTGERGALAATNGHILFAARFDAAALPDFQRIIPRALLEGRMPLPKTSVQVMDKTITVMTPEYGRVGQAIDGRFPDWRAAIPDELNGEPGQFDPRYLAILGKVAKLCEVTYPGLNYGGKDKAAVATFHGEALFAVMPMRADVQPLTTWHKPTSRSTK